MPLALKPKEIKNEFDGSKSVLIVACSVCPKMCLAAQNKKPYFSLFGGSSKNALKEYMQSLHNLLTQKGIATIIFKASIDAPMCLWPLKNRQKITKLADNHDAIAVIGCDSALATVKSSVTSAGKNIVQIMDVAGIANFISRINFPFDIYLEAAIDKEIPI
jgi:hypothetical protein